MNAVTPALTVVALQNEDVLRWLAANGRPESTAALARAIGRDKSNLSKTLQSMQREGLLDADLEFLEAGVHALAALDRANGRGGELTAPWSAFKPHPLNPRKSFDEAELDELGHDIMARGQDQNIVCRPPGADGVLYIRSGERRWRSIGRRIEAGDAPANFAIRYIVRDENDAEHLIGALGENLQRSALNPIEEARAFAYMRDELAMTTAEIAKRISKTQRFVQLRLQLMTAPEITQVALAAGKITVQDALAQVQQAKPKPAEPAQWAPTPAQALVLTEIAAKWLVEPHPITMGAVNAGRSAQADRDLSIAVREGFAMWAGVPNETRVSILQKGWDWLAAADLDPRSNPTALFSARSRTGMPLHAIKDLESAGRWVTDWLNVAPWKSSPPPTAPTSPTGGAAPSEGAAAAPAAPSRSFADQVADATDDADETAEMFPDAREQAAPEREAPDTNQRNAYAHARQVMDGAAADAGAFLVAIEHDGDFNWAAADCPTLADKLAYYFAGESVLGVLGVAAALYARGGADLFTERALRGAYDGLRRKALTDIAYLPELDRPVKLGFGLTATGEIVDADESGLIASVYEGVSNEDAAAMAAGPELLRAVRGLLAVAPQIDPDDLDVEAETAWRYAAEVMALATRLGDQ